MTKMFSVTVATLMSNEGRTARLAAFFPLTLPMQALLCFVSLRRGSVSATNKTPFWPVELSATIHPIGRCHESVALMSFLLDTPTPVLIARLETDLVHGIPAARRLESSWRVTED